ncbi:extracellular solute-binding protein [Litoribrevibacter albus]|uniref:Extracellular solute-binding protein n=1 Tax=Litoribrevibacter albus TaxID=1473156 RepID=A0AA37SDU1_9GAMM|nr:extracellular solute-binding protein [Litoribrevibacter albus]GLQ33353.1 hypothetical protein GCM10007876_38330 [Litoribrevibacter albus]
MKKTIGMFVVVMMSFMASCFAQAEPTKVSTLRVALYPYVPDRLALFHKIEAIFESGNPGVNLELVDDSSILWDYYSGGLQATKADVYEVDTILLSDLIQSGKITELKLPREDYSDEVKAAVSRNGKTYGVPHWLCGNFLFYKKGDTEIESAATWGDLNKILSSRNESLFVDFKGKSTLGEWYLTVLSELYGLDEAQTLISESDRLDDEALSKLNVMLESCPAGFCRSDDLHDRTGYYSRAFVSGKSSAYVGYSESLHYGIQYYLDNCTESSGCVSPEDIAVRRLPDFAKATKSGGIGWVDALAVDAKLTPTKQLLAMKFIEFMASDEAYQAVLAPDWGEAPKYLISATTTLDIKGAPLYPALYSAHSGRGTGIHIGLNDKLRAIGNQLDCELPISRTDKKTLERCAK